MSYDDLSDAEYKEVLSEYEAIAELVASGVLGEEQCPQPTFWRWPVIKPELLPERFKENFNCYGEIRWYGSS